MNVNAIAFSPPPLSLSMIQRHDLWFVSVFQDHPSSAGSAAAPPVVNHSESLSLISINRSSVALVSASLNLPFFFFLFSTPPPPPPPHQPSSPTPLSSPSVHNLQPRRVSVPFAASSAYLLFNKLTTFSHAMNKKALRSSCSRHLLLLHYSWTPYKCHAADS